MKNYEFTITRNDGTYSIEQGINPCDSVPYEEYARVAGQVSFLLECLIEERTLDDLFEEYGCVDNVTYTLNEECDELVEYKG